MVPEIPLIFDDKDIFNVLATRHLTDRQIPVIDISEAGRLPRGIPCRRFRVSRGRKRAELQRCQIGGFFVNCNNLKELPDIWAKSYIQRHAAPSVEWADYRISIPAGICSK